MNVNEYIGFMLYVIYYTTKLKIKLINNTYNVQNRFCKRYTSIIK